jgi:hypothetical protein
LNQEVFWKIIKKLVINCVFYGVRQLNSGIFCPQTDPEIISEGEKVDFLERMNARPERLARDASQK